MPSFILVIVSSFFAALILLYFLIPVFRIFILDLPNTRSSHSVPTPRGGGSVFVVLSVISCTFLLFHGHPAMSSNSIPLLAFPLSLIGFLDDRYDLSSVIRYLFHLLTAFLIIYLCPLSFHIVLLPVFVIAITAVINFTNFMDGIDGLVAGCMSVSISLSCLVLNVPWTLWVLVGSLFAFLFWNWHPAKVFMGDVGSTFLGAVFAGLILHSTSWLQALSLLLVSTPLLADAFFCVFRRSFAGQRIFQPHRLHLFQRLIQAGWSHARVSSLYISATSLLALTMLFAGMYWLLTIAFAELLFGFWLDQRAAVPFAVASKL